VATFEDAVEYVLEREQGFVNSPSDSGGATNFGISLRFLRSLSEESQRKYGIFEPINEQTIKDLSLEQARCIYKSEFWDHSRFADVRCQLVCNYLFDMAVNCGIAQSIKILQRSLWALSYSRKFMADDGILGDHTLDRLNIIIPDMILPVLVASRAAYYRLLAEKRPKDKENLDGWLNRAYRI
jgi:lysozyme family protein